MIRIFMEAKEDFDRIVDLCTKVMLKKIMKQEDDPTYQQSYDRLKNYYQNKIEQFKANKNTVKAPYNDITYWYKEIKDKGYEASALFEQFVESMSRNTEDKKRFREIYPASLVRKFENGKYKLDLLDQFYYNWVKAVDDYGRDAKEMEGTLRKLLIDRVGYSKEDIEEIENGTQEIMSYNDWDLYLITNYEAAEYYGQGTGWCISGNYPGHENRGRHHFEEYLEDADPHGYFFLIKGGEKYCIFNSLEYNEVQIWQGTNGDDTKIKIIPDHIPDEIVEAYNDYNDSYGTSFELKKLYIPETEDEQREVIYKFLDNHDITRILVHTGFDLEKLVDQYVHEYYSDDDDMLFENIIENKIKAGQWFPHLIFSTSLELYDKKYGLNEKALTQNEFNSLSDSEKEDYLMRNISPIVSYMEEKFGNIYYFLLSINEEPNHRTPSGATINKVIGDLSLENEIIVNLIMDAGFGKSISLQIANNRV